MNTVTQQRRLQRIGLPASLLVLAPVWFLGSPNAALAQNAWSSSSISTAVKAIRANQSAPQNQNSVQARAEGKGAVIIQSITQGRIPKFQNAGGTLEDSVITESSTKVGIGTTGPNRLLHIRDAAIEVFTGARVSVSSDTSDPVYELLHEDVNRGFRWRLGNATLSDFYLDYTTNGFQSHTPYLSVLNNGNLGIGTGTGSPGNKLNVYTTTSNDGISVDGTIHPGMNFKNSGTVKGYFGLATGANGWVAGSAANDVVLRTEDATNGNIRFVTQAGSLTPMIVTRGGTIGIGTITPDPALKLHVSGSARVTGNMTVDGNIAAKYQDVAEWVPSRSELPEGTVVIIDPDRSNHVLASWRAYDTRVAGVISARPGVVLGESGAGKVMVATTGRVKIKVDATAAPIRVGDLLVTSDTEGIAMRSQPLDLGGTPIHRPGTLIGKALEPLDRGVGEILVLLSLQ